MKKKVIKPIILIVAFLMLFNMSNIFLNKSYAEVSITGTLIQQQGNSCEECEADILKVWRGSVSEREYIEGYNNESNNEKLAHLKYHINEKYNTNDEGSQPGLSGGVSDINDIIDDWDPNKALGDDDELTQRASVIATVIRNVGILVSIGSLMAIGIKYMLSSVEERARYKETMIPWAIGAVLVFAMTTIPSLLLEIANGLFLK